MRALQIIQYGILVAFLFMMGMVSAQEEKTDEEESGYQFTDTKVVPHTPVKDQHHSGTCWSFAGTSFVEAEVLRAGGPELDLAEMYSVRDAYEKRADNYIRLHGKYNFGPGGEPHQIMTNHHGEGNASRRCIRRTYHWGIATCA